MEAKAQFHSCKKSAEIVVSLDDLLLQILPLLPIKSLIRFKLVSKRWLSLIGDPKFYRLHSSFQLNVPVGLFLLLDSKHRYEYDYFCSDSNHKREYDYVPLCIEGSRNRSFGILDFAPDPYGIEIEDTCNGLFLCCSRFNRQYYVYNPTTRKFSVIPESEQRFGVWNKYFQMSLAFDPVDSPHYKPICLCQVLKKTYQMEIYSSETQDWTILGEPFSSDLSFSRGVYWNRSIHWMREWECDLFYFHIDHHVLDKMPPPPVWGGFESYCHMMVSVGRLHAIERTDPYHATGRNLQYVVYELKADYSEWFVKYQLDLSHLAYTFPVNVPNYTYYCHGLSLVRGGDEEEDESFLVLEVPGRVIRYNIVSDSVQNLYEFDLVHDVDKNYKYASFGGFIYVESLCCV